MHWAIMAIVGIGLAGGAISYAAEPQVKDDVVQKITAAAPEKARVQPQQPRKVLVFTLTRGFAHDSIPVASKAMEILGKKTGAFETVISDDISYFEPEKLQQFDAVIMNSTTGELFSFEQKGMQPTERAAAKERSERLKKSLLDFVSGGKGIVGIHAATDCCYSWPEYGKMMGGFFDGHPWSEKVGVKIDDPQHPLTAVFQGQGFAVTDEIYQFRQPYSRENLRVLLSLDTSRINMTKRGINRKDGDFAVAWVQNWGQGRVFYCSLGHWHDIFWTPNLLQFYLDGIQFALGDLPADATPSAKLTATPAEAAQPN